MEQLLNVWVLSVLVHFVESKDSSVDVFHLAIKIQDV
jgi:hypothetical protein